MSCSERKFIRLSRLLSSLPLAIMLLYPMTLLGAEQPEPPASQPIPQTSKADSFDSMEPSRNYLSGKIGTFANYVDHFFGGDRHYQESNQSVVQVDMTRASGYGGDSKFKLAGRVNLKLPVTEGRLHLLLETDPENNITDQPIPGLVVPTQNSTVLHNKVVVPRSLALAARYTTAKENVWHFSTDWGLKFPIPPKPFVRTRASYSTMMSKWRLKAAESVYWFNTLGAGETTQLDLERIISTPLLFRSTSIVTWLNDNKNFDLRQDLSIYHTLNDRTALLYQASAVGVSNPQFQVTDYDLLLFCRYRLHQQWLFFEVSPQLHFPRDRNYKASAALSMRLEILFDESRH